MSEMPVWSWIMLNRSEMSVWIAFRTPMYALIFWTYLRISEYETYSRISEYETFDDYVRTRTIREFILVHLLRYFFFGEEPRKLATWMSKHLHNYFTGACLVNLLVFSIALWLCPNVMMDGEGELWFLRNFFFRKMQSLVRLGGYLLRNEGWIMVKWQYRRIREDLESPYADVMPYESHLCGSFL